MKANAAAALCLLLSAAPVAIAQSSGASGTVFENGHLKLTVRPGWTIDSSAPPVVKLTHGKYVLIINPIVLHAMAFPSVSQITSELPSVQAVQEADPSASGTDCAQPHRPGMMNKLELMDLYTNDTRENACCCKFPSSGKSVWFASYYLGESDGPTGAFSSIAAGFDSSDVNALPQKNDPQLREMLAEIDIMVKSLVVMAPLAISSVEPASVVPGATVALRGRGFNLPNDFDIGVKFEKFPDLCMPTPNVAADGKSLIFQVPACLVTGDCQPMNGPQSSACDTPFPPGRYEISVTGNEIRSNFVTLNVTAPQR